MNLDRHSLEQAADGLALAFYLLIVGALFAVITGTVGVAFFLLVLAAVAHVGRWTLEELVASRGEEARLELDLRELRDRLSRLRLPSRLPRTPSARRRR